MANQKNLYHSELVQMGPVTVTVTTDILKSKYAGKPDYVGLSISGVPRTYSVENSACAAFFSGQKGKTLQIVASGSREDAAIDDAGAGSGAEAEPPPCSNYPHDTPPSETHGWPATEAKAAKPAAGKAAGPQPQPDLHAAKLIVGRAGNLWGLAAKALSHQLQVLNKDADTAWIPAAFAGDPQAIQAAIATICIQSDRNGVFWLLPPGDEAHAPKGGAK